MALARDFFDEGQDKDTNILAVKALDLVTGGRGQAIYTLFNNIGNLSQTAGDAKRSFSDFANYFLADTWAIRPEDSTKTHDNDRRA